MAESAVCQVFLRFSLLGKSRVLIVHIPINYRMAIVTHSGSPHYVLLTVAESLSSPASAEHQ
jgi:hypothetical protein